MVKMTEVWDRTTRFLRENRGTVATVAGLAIFLPSVIPSLLPGPSSPDVGAAMAIVSVVVALATTLVTLIGQIAIVALALDATLGTGGAFSVAGRRFLPVLGVSIVLVLGLALILVPFGLIMINVGGFDLAAFSVEDPGVMIQSGEGSPGLFFLMFLVLFAAMLWITARLAPLLSVIVWERRGIGAIARAFSLTRGLALRLIGMFFLFGIVAGVAMLAVMGVFGAIFAIAAGGIETGTVGGVLLALIVSVLTTLFTVIYTVFLTKLYKSLVEDREPAAVFE